MAESAYRQSISLKRGVHEGDVANDLPRPGVFAELVYVAENGVTFWTPASSRGTDFFLSDPRSNALDEIIESANAGSGLGRALVAIHGRQVLESSKYPAFEPTPVIGTSATALVVKAVEAAYDARNHRVSPISKDTPTEDIVETVEVLDRHLLKMASILESGLRKGPEEGLSVVKMCEQEIAVRLDAVL